MDRRFTNLLKEIHEYSPGAPFWENNPNDVYIYGTGTMGSETCRIMLSQGIPIRGFLDHRIREPLFDGLPVWSPEAPEITYIEREKANIVIALHNPFANLHVIYGKLFALGYKHLINPIEIYDYLGKEMGIRYWLTERNFYKPFGPILTKVYSLFEDNESRNIFISILEHRISGDYNRLPSVDWEHRYAPVDIPSWESPVRLIDCGAFDGDSITDIQKAGIQFSAIVAFEPDSNTFQKLRNYFEINDDLCKDVTLWPCGVHSSTTQLSFNDNQGKSSNLSQTGNATVQCVSIDDVLPTFAPTLIKMDIEGAEYDALIGAQKTIQKYKPGLAISLYHRPEHLWQIPLLIERLINQSTFTNTERPNCTYKYFIRSHQMNGYELVFYAVPTA